MVELPMPHDVTDEDITFHCPAKKGANSPLVARQNEEEKSAEPLSVEGAVFGRDIGDLIGRDEHPTLYTRERAGDPEVCDDKTTRE